jgi:hypothetical protein
MSMKPQQSLVPHFVCLIVFVLSTVFPVVFLRDPGAWVILLGLAPFGLLQLLGLFLIVNAFTQPAPEGLEQEEERGVPAASAGVDSANGSHSNNSLRSPGVA